MRGRIGCGIALGLLAGLGGTGCATSKPRAEAPPQFRTWNTPAASRSADAGLGPGVGGSNSVGPVSSGSIVSPANRPTFPWSEPTGPARPTLSGWNWRYKPGSLFRKATRTPAATPAAPTGSDGSLARFFPGLYGQGSNDPNRLAAARRAPQVGRLGDGPIVTTRGTRKPVDDVSSLPVAIEARAYPGAPSAAIDGMTRLARRDRPGSADERLTSHEEPAPEPPAPRPRPRAMSRPRVGAVPLAPPSSMDDAVASELGGEPTARMDAARPSPSSPDSRPSSATVPIRAGALRLAQAAPAADSDEEDGPDLRIEPLQAVPTTRPRPAMAAAPERPRPPVAAAAPAPSGRPRSVQVRPMELPPPEFPATYHTESLRMVLRERGTASVDPDARPASLVERPETRKLVLPPWLARLWPRPAVDDVAFTPTSARRNVAGQAR